MTSLNLLTRFGSEVPADKYSIPREYESLTADSALIAEQLRIDIRNMSPLRFNACFASVAETIHSVTTSPSPADSTGRTTADDVPIRYFLIGLTLDTRSIPDSEDDSSPVDDGQMPILDAETKFVLREVGGNIAVTNRPETLENTDYFLSLTAIGSSIPKVGEVDPNDPDMLRGYFDGTLRNRIAALQQKHDAEAGNSCAQDQHYHIYEHLIGGSLEKFSDLDGNTSPQN